MGMVNYREAQNIIKSQAILLHKELIDLDDSLGRVLAEDIVAGRDYPPFNRSAMDGIAIQTEDFGKGTRDFRIIETVFAGQKSEKNLSAGQCYKIMTGAAVPAGADAVIRREDIIEDKAAVRVETDSCERYQNIAPQGEDLKKDTIALHAPFKINASATGFIASMGRGEIWVYKKPDVVIFTTGDEVISVGEQVNDQQIYNSNLPMLKALMLEHQIKPIHAGHILDDEEQLEDFIKPYLGVDILILSGGVSAGDADFIPDILDKLGVEILFHKVAIKPGKPCLCGKLPGGGLVFALPGNPLSCLVTFKLFVERYLEGFSNLPAPDTITFPLNFNRRKKSAFDEFFPVFITEQNMLNKIDFNGSGDIRLASFANALGIQPADQMDIWNGEGILCIRL